jgi:two-component system sensor histidine kinase HydH
MAVGLVFSYFHYPTPRMMYLVGGVGILYRLLELSTVRRNPPLSPHIARALAMSSILWNLILPFLLAAATQQFHSHYFGLLILPVLEAALYFSFTITLLVSATASACAFFWVVYAANFTPPFQLGELLESTTLILLFFIVGTLVWWLVDRLSDRERQLGQRVFDLETTKGKLVEEEKLAAIGRLASAVAHEIRNPVAIISSAVEVAISPDFSTDDRDEMAKVAIVEARRLEKLTTDFLTYAQPGVPIFSEVDATALVGHISSIGRAQGLYKQIHMDLRVEENCSVLGNESLLQQVLLNLLRNAIEASPELGNIIIQVSRVTDKIRISFENSGPRIPPHAAPQIFEPFYTAKHGGTGLGLAIAKSIVEKHGGSLLLERNENDAIVFVVTLIPFCDDAEHLPTRSEEGSSRG